ncbi:hypothetical protein Slin15195_G091590 [Septoria linicola]|uniref:Uncharacterized protein n=1 Tax=Septoria linicola TaxID=215465 RepID=A0A9Q9B0E1_9PEZI|nr:hypothetical protein Slin15195_G091590 [Septoria linicola]
MLRHTYGMRIPALDDEPLLYDECLDLHIAADKYGLRDLQLATKNTLRNIIGDWNSDDLATVGIALWAQLESNVSDTKLYECLVQRISHYIDYFTECPEKWNVLISQPTLVRLVVEEMQGGKSPSLVDVETLRGAG